MAKFSFYRYFYEQWSTIPRPEPVDLRSKTFLVTGSNVGLGYEASVHLAKMGPKSLFATSRDLAKCEQTRKSILENMSASDAPSVEVNAWPLELGSFKSVRAFVDEFAANSNRSLDALIANAGLLSGESYVQTEDGWEITLQVNYISTALLSILLLPYLISSASPDLPSRLVIVSSFAHYFTWHLETTYSESWENIFENFNKPEYGNSGMRYQLTKLLEVIFVRELASRLPQSASVIACTVNPGLCRSTIFRGARDHWIYSLLKKLFFERSTEGGSRTLVHAAVASDYSMHGRYLSCGIVAEECDFLFTPKGMAFSARVWAETITLLSSIDGRVSDIVEKYLRD